MVASLLACTEQQTFSTGYPRLPSDTQHEPRKNGGSQALSASPGFLLDLDTGACVPYFLLWGLMQASPPTTELSSHLFLSSLQLLNQILPLMGCEMPHANFFISEPLFSNCHPQQLHVPLSKKRQRKRERIWMSTSPQTSRTYPDISGRVKFLQELLGKSIEQTAYQ